MAAAVDDIDTAHGGIERYLTAEVGLATATLEQLRDQLLEPGAEPASSS
jgi:hypothetical protein